MSEYRLIPLSGKYGAGKHVKVSVEDFAWASKHRWTQRPDGYVVRSRWRQEKLRSARFLHKEVLGVEESQQGDHRNHDLLDCTRKNLRPCSSQQNNRNKRAHKNAISQYKGIGWDAKAGVWVARITINRRTYNLGTFKDELAAAKVYDACARFYFGEFAFTNFVGVETYDRTEARRQNKRNRGDRSGYIGVRKHRGKWKAMISLKCLGLGRQEKTCGSEIEAAQFYDQLVKKYGLKRPLNFE